MLGRDAAEGGGLLVIVGAGASHDSAPYHMAGVHRVDESWRPPLADQLFERPEFQATLSNYPDALAILPQLSNVGKGTTLERVLDKVRSEASSYPPRWSQLTAIRFYLRDLLAECQRRWTAATSRHSNYFALLDQLREWRLKKGRPVCIVTFNYDLMLEDALPTVGIDWSSIDGYVANKDWPVIKPHGSVNWARPVNTRIELGNVQGLIRQAANGLDVSDKFVIADRNLVAIDDKMLLPAIAIPLENGKDFECPSEHLRVLEDFVGRTTQILIIGWRATEKSFLELLTKNMPSQMRFFVHLVCRDHDGATETFANLRSAGVALNAVPMEYGGFSQLMRSEDLRTRLV